MKAELHLGEMRRLARDAVISASELHDSLETVLITGSVAGVGTARVEAPVFTGEAANSIQARGLLVVEAPPTIAFTDVIRASAPHAAVIEDGRQPGATPPPIAPIRRWVQLMSQRGEIDISWAGEGDDAVNTAAAVIRRSIGKRGLPARKFMQAGADAAEAAMEAALSVAVEKFRSRLSS